MKKEKYYDLEMEIIHFAADDVITESGGELGGGEYPGGEIPPEGE